MPVAIQSLPRNREEKERSPTTGTEKTAEFKQKTTPNLWFDDQAEEAVEF